MEYITDSKKRSRLISLAMNLKDTFQIGKDGLKPEMAQEIRTFLDKNELIKIHILKNADIDKNEAAQILSQRTGSEVVQVIGNKIVLFKYQRDADKRKIDL